MDKMDNLLLEEFEEEFEEFEMPTPCQNCSNWFDLNDGTASSKWFPNTMICRKCGDEEEEEIERDGEIEDLKNAIDEAGAIIEDARVRLMELGIETKRFTLNLY